MRHQFALRYLSVFALALVAAACTPAAPPAPGTTPSPLGGSGRPTASAAASPAPSPAASGPSAEIDVTITGGPHDGNFRAAPLDACKNIPAQNRFTVNYADDSAADGFVALDLVLNDAAQAIADESGDFLAHLSVGGANGGVSYTIDPKAGQGDGTVFLDTSPSDATLDLEVDMSDGASIEILVTCELA